MTGLDGSRVLVTGGASGLGRAIVDRFVAEGARVAVLDRSAEKLVDLRRQHGDEVICITGDVRSPEDNAEAVAAAAKRFGGLDVFIGNAGIWDYNASLASFTGQQLQAAFDEIFAVNVSGYLFGVQAALGCLVETGGSVILTASTASFNTSGGGILYTASKHAVVGVVRQLAYELAPRVRVNGVAPGAIASDLRGPAALGLAGQSLGSTLDLEAFVPQVTPLRRLADATEYVGPYALLASRRDSSTITGVVIECDGGMGVRGFASAAGGDGLAETLRHGA